MPTNDKMNEKTNEGSESTMPLEDLVSEAAHTAQLQLQRFLGDTEKSVAGFFKNIRHSADEVLELAEHPSVSMLAAVFVTGAAIGALAVKRLRSASASPAASKEAGISVAKDRALRAAT